MKQSCWVGGCTGQVTSEVTNPYVALVTPVVTCSAHLGDLMGNIVKAAIKTNPTWAVTVQAKPLPQEA